MEMEKDVPKQLDFDFSAPPSEAEVAVVKQPTAQIFCYFQSKEAMSRKGAPVPESQLKERIESLLSRYK